MPTKKHGFTIIEVVLVLAIAGLIFLMVFVALPSLQRSQRDTQRRQDMARVVTALNQYKANNNGKLPILTSDIAWNWNSSYDINNCANDDNGRACKFVRDYLNPAGATASEFKDPDGTRYGLGFYAYEDIHGEDYPGDSMINAKSPNDNSHKIFIKLGVKCGADQSAVNKHWEKSSPNSFAVLYKLESGIICLDSE